MVATAAPREWPVTTSEYEGWAAFAEETADSTADLDSSQASEKPSWISQPEQIEVDTKSKKIFSIQLRTESLPRKETTMRVFLESIATKPSSPVRMSLRRDLGRVCVYEFGRAYLSNSTTLTALAACTQCVR
jgi:hypothetical protein